MRRSFLLACTLLGIGMPVRAQNLDQTLVRVARYWANGDVRSIMQNAAASGFALELGRDRVGPVAARQASAALKRLFDDRETLAVNPVLTRVVGGDPPRAFGELEWITRPRGTTIPERRTVFVALVQQAEGWRVTEIRVMQ